jgi:hypothetical protein
VTHACVIICGIPAAHFDGFIKLGVKADYTGQDIKKLFTIMSDPSVKFID